MKITCGSCGVPVDTSGPPHVCATEATVTRHDLAPTEVRLPVVPPRDRPVEQHQPNQQHRPTPQHHHPAGFAPPARPSASGPLPWFAAGAALVLLVTGVLVLVTRGGGNATGTVTTSLVAEPQATKAPIAPDTPVPETPPVDAPVVDAPVVDAPAETPAPVAPSPTVRLPSATWNGDYFAEPPVGPLFIGHKGPRVDTLQIALINRGYLSPPIDGDFGPATENAVVRFQQDYGLIVDGIAGPGTLAALGI